MLHDFALAIAPACSPAGRAAFVDVALVTCDDEAATLVSMHTEVPTLVDHQAHASRPSLRCIRSDQGDEEARVFDMRRVLAGRMASRRELSLSIERALTAAELAQPISVPEVQATRPRSA